MDACTTNVLQIRNCIWAGLRAGNSFISTVGGFDAAGWYNTSEHANRSYAQPAEVGLGNPFSLPNPNPVPGAASPAATGADFSNARLTDPFFTPTAYVGAFSTGTRWDAGWTNYDPQTTAY